MRVVAKKTFKEKRKVRVTFCIGNPQTNEAVKLTLGPIKVQKLEQTIERGGVMLSEPKDLMDQLFGMGSPGSCPEVIIYIHDGEWEIDPK